jgi:hypothetical protein
MSENIQGVPVSPALISGVTAGGIGLLTFLTIHHFWIKPIWFILPAGLVVVVLGGLAVGWSYHELIGALPPRPWTALAVLALIAAMLAPAIIIAQVRPPLADLTTQSLSATVSMGQLVAHFVLELLLPATAIGAALGWLLGRSWQASLATALAGLAYALGPGHNIPFLGGSPVAAKGLALLFVPALVAAVALVEIHFFLTHR